MTNDTIEAKIASIERTLRQLKAEVRRRKKGAATNGGQCLISIDPGYDGEEVHRRRLRRRDLRGLSDGRMGDILDIINASMERMEPDGEHGVWSTLKHNRDLILAIRAKALE